MYNLVIPSFEEIFPGIALNTATVAITTEHITLSYAFNFQLLIFNFSFLSIF